MINILFSIGKKRTSDIFPRVVNNYKKYTIS